MLNMISIKATFGIAPQIGQGFRALNSNLNAVVRIGLHVGPGRAPEWLVRKPLSNFNVNFVACDKGFFVKRSLLET